MDLMDSGHNVMKGLRYMIYFGFINFYTVSQNKTNNIILS